MLGVINVPASRVLGRETRMKNAIYLTPLEDELNNRERMEIELFARKHDLRVIGESHYPFSIPILNPDDFVNILSNMNADTFIFDDECLIFADIYNDGEIVKNIKEKGITIYNKELDCELEAISSVLNKDLKNKIKNAVTNALEEICLGGEQIAVITANVDNEDFVNYITALSERTKKDVLTICMNEYGEVVKPVLGKYIKEKNIDRLIIYGDELLSPEFEEAIEELSKTCKFEYEYCNQEQEFNHDIRMN